MTEWCRYRETDREVDTKRKTKRETLRVKKYRETKGVRQSGERERETERQIDR